MPHAETESLGFFSPLFFVVEWNANLYTFEKVMWAECSKGHKCNGCFYARQRLTLIRSFAGDVNQRELRSEKKKKAIEREKNGWQQETVDHVTWNVLINNECNHGSAHLIQISVCITMSSRKWLSENNRWLFVTNGIKCGNTVESSISSCFGG